jgi:hypothetical protein
MTTRTKRLRVTRRRRSMPGSGIGPCSIVDPFREHRSVHLCFSALTSGRCWFASGAYVHGACAGNLAVRPGSAAQNPRGDQYPIRSRGHNRVVGSSNPIRSTTQSLEPADFPETAEEPAIGGLLRLGFGLRRDRFWPEGDFGRSVSRPRNPVSPMQIDLG